MQSEKACGLCEIRAAAEEAGCCGDVVEVLCMDCGSGAIVAGFISEGCGELEGEDAQLRLRERNQGCAG